MCIYIYIYIYIYINIFPFVVEWFAECCCRHVDECRSYSCRINQSLLKKSMNHIILNLLNLHITLLYYIILHLALILLIIYIYVKTEMVKLNWRGLDCGN